MLCMGGGVSDLFDPGVTSLLSPLPVFLVFFFVFFFFFFLYKKKKKKNTKKEV